jgi:gliding motility-associated lipoprotein GldH
MDPKKRIEWKSVNTNYNYQKLLIIIPLLALVIGCKEQIVFEQNQKTDEMGWPANEILNFEFEVKDTTQLFDIFLNVRNTTEYEYSNLYVFFQTDFPDGRTFRDTVEMILADHQGKWTGKGFGKLKSNSFHFRKDVWFPDEGVYEFTIQHAMREELLKGISDMGIKIEKK